MASSSNALHQVVNSLLQIKHTVQRGDFITPIDLMARLDVCISKIMPYVDVYSSSSVINPLEENVKARSHIMEKTWKMPKVNSSEYVALRKSADEEILKVKNSFIQKASETEKELFSVQKQQEGSNVLLDYFSMKYNLSLNEYFVFGKKGGKKTDRKVFVDLLTFENKRTHISKLQKTESMTNILRQVFSQSKPSEPFILPNCQQDQTKYLFVFGLSQCGSIAEQYYKTETMCCFVSNEFILGQLMHLMNQISKVCFEQQVYEASRAHQKNLAQTVSLLHGKKTYQCMEKVIEDYLRKRDTLSTSKLFSFKLQQSYPTTIDHYLQQSSLMWSTVSRGKQHKFIITLILLYYLTLSQYKIVFLAETKNRHAISELMLGLIRSLEPLNYVYPIVGTTLTNHHFQFANSPVPIMVGFWGNSLDYAAAKNNLKKMIKVQKNLSPQDLSTETLLAVVDLQDNTVQFLQSSFKQTCYVCDKIRDFLQSCTNELVSTKLSHLTTMLTQGHRSEDWMLTLAKNLKVTQMYDYFIAKKK